MGEEQARFLTATAESSPMKRQGRRAERFVRGGMGRPSGGGWGGHCGSPQQAPATPALPRLIRRVVKHSLTIRRPAPPPGLMEQVTRSVGGRRGAGLPDGTASP